MKNIEKAISLLNSNGFELIEKDTSPFFGDYHCVFNNGNIQLMFRSCRSFEMVDVRSYLPNQDWHDLALVKALLYDEKNLNKVTIIEEHIDFLEKELAKITELFNDRNYQETRKRLEELQNKRAKQMFPGMMK